MTERQVKLGKELQMAAATRVAEELFKHDAASQEEPILLIINTRSGFAPAAMIVVDAVQAVRSPVYAVIQSEALGVGAIVATFCDRVYAFPHASFLFSPLQYDTEKIMEESPPLPAEAATSYINRVYQSLAPRLQMSLDELKTKLESNWYLTAQEAHRSGIVTEIVQHVNWIDLVVETVEIKRTRLDKQKHPIPQSDTEE
jgi:ATP-dependent protease ClpP protease subunit